MKAMHYAVATRNGHTIEIPCWNGRCEANHVVRTMTANGWGAHVKRRVIDEFHPHWRSTLPNARTR